MLLMSRCLYFSRSLPINWLVKPIKSNYAAFINTYNNRQQLLLQLQQPTTTKCNQRIGIQISIGVRTSPHQPGSAHLTWVHHIFLSPQPSTTNTVNAVPMTPIIAFERLFFAVFGQTSPDDINSQRSTRPEWTENLFKIVFGIYMLVSVVVLINLLIAMMSDTYQRIQVSPKWC